MKFRQKSKRDSSLRFFHKSIGFKFLLVVGFFAFGFSLFVLYCSWSQSDTQMKKLLHSQSEMALQFDLAIREYVAESIRPFAQQYVDKDDFVPELMSTSFVARSVFEKVRRKFPDYIIKFSSDNPRNPSNQAGHEELLVLDYFNKNPELETWTGQLTLDGKTHMAHFSARRMKKACLGCHGEPSDAPKALIDRYGDKAGFRRPLGEVIALDTVAVPIDKFKSAAIRQTAKNFLFLIIGLCILLAVIYYAFHRLVGSKLANISKHFKSAVDNDEKLLVSSINYKSDDEVGRLIKYFNILADRLRNVYNNLEKRVADRTKELEDVNSYLQQEIKVRKQEQEKNRQQSEFLRSILESLPHPFYVIDINDYTIKMANSAANLGELTEDSKCYKLTRQNNQPCDSSSYPCPIEIIKRTGQPVVLRHIHHDKNGKAQNVELHAYPIFDSEGNISHITEYSFNVPDDATTEQQMQAHIVEQPNTN